MFACNKNQIKNGFFDLENGIPILEENEYLEKQKIFSKREDFLLVFVAGSRIELETSGL